MAGKWNPLTHQPNFTADTMLLLTDGSVMCHEDVSANWHKLVPDASGSYVNGTWSSIKPLHDIPTIPAAVGGPTYAPLYFASAVLKDGRVFVAGGEYNKGISADLLAAEIYDPVADVWTVIGTPSGWTQIGDAPSCVLADGRVLLGSIHTTASAIYDPVANTWTAAGTKNDNSSEETWTLLPDNTVLTAECSAAPKAEKYVAASDKWVSAGSTPKSLVEASSSEIGPAILLPNGHVFAVGATSATALYTPPAVPAQPGSWKDGPTLPSANNN